MASERHVVQCSADIRQLRDFVDAVDQSDDLKQLRRVSDRWRSRIKCNRYYYAAMRQWDVQFWKLRNPYRSSS